MEEYMNVFIQSDSSVVIYASTHHHNLIKECLRDYKLRWNESIANKIAYTDILSELPKGSTIIIPTYLSYQINPLDFKRVVNIDAIQNISIYELRRAVIETSYRYTKSVDEARRWLSELPSTFSYDCETTGLSVHNDSLTMFSFAPDETTSIVLSNEPGMEKLVMDFLTTTESTVIMHNASFDMKIVRHRTGKFIKHFEDTQLLARCYTNHADSDKAKTGLKHLAGKVYSQWAVSKELFGIEHKYNENLIAYAGVDSAATMFLWKEFSIIDPVWTSHTFSELFPIQPPSLHEESPRYFYENVLKPLVPSMIDLMLNGIPLDMSKVDTLETRLDEILDKVRQDLLQNSVVQNFQKLQFTRLKQSKIDEYNLKKRDIRQYLKEYKPDDIVMRSWLVNTYLKSQGAFNFVYYPTDFLPNGHIKWTVSDITKFYKNNPTHRIFSSIIDKTIAQDNEYVVTAMVDLARYKTELYNTDYDIKIGAIDTSILPLFNPGSSKQLIDLFSFLQIEPLAYTPAGSPSWGRDQIAEISYSLSDINLIALCKAIIEYSQASIIRSTFITAFNKYTVNGVLYGNIRIAGAKTYRPTSDKPNLNNIINNIDYLPHLMKINK
jgi:hypothetical protein